MSKTAIILGATGLTGGILLEQLINDDRYTTIKLFSRKSVDNSDPKVEEHLIDMLNLENYQKYFTADEVFCCIGTTNAKTPDKKLYHKIDYGIPVTAANLCQKNNINTLIIISAIGADASSSVFYNKVKGQMEDTILNLKIPKVHILQPSLIGGKRIEKRTGEYFLKQLMKITNPLFIGSLKKYKSILPHTIVSAMVWLANNEYHSKKIISDKIEKIG